MPHLPNGGFQAASHGSERRADFDLLRRVHELEHLTIDQAEQIAVLQALTWEETSRTVALGSTGSGSFVNWPTSAALSATVTKVRADTDLVISLSVSFFVATVANTSQDFAVLIGGTDYTVIDSAQNPLDVHTGRSGHLAIGGLAAGSHVVTLRGRILGGGSLTCDGNDTQSWCIRERFP